MNITKIEYLNKIPLTPGRGTRHGVEKHCAGVLQNTSLNAILGCFAVNLGSS